MDYYKILGVATNASRTEIKSAYRLLALKLHPDVSHNNDPNKRQEFARVNEAYETLNDVDKRKSYDKLIGLNKILKRDRTKNNYNGYSHDPYAPRKKVDPKHFNEPVWNAWHYGDNAISKPAVTQLNNYMHLKDNKDQAYFRKKMNSNRLNINIEEYNVNNYNTHLKQETKNTNDVKETATENLNLKRNERKANNNNNNDKANESCCIS